MNAPPVDLDSGILYIHPYGHLDNRHIPIGLVGLMNLVDVPKLGRFSFEVSKAEIQSAACIALDLHWYFPLGALRGMLVEIKQHNPSVPIVLGGITASFFARHLVKNYALDYLVWGDGEPSFPTLVRYLTKRKNPPELPNVYTAKGPPYAYHSVTPGTYSRLDYLTLDWFPTFQKAVFSEHDRYHENPHWDMDNYHPYLPLNRSCIFDCEFCFGGYKNEVFCDTQINRSLESFEKILADIERHPKYRFVTVFCGTEEAKRIDGYRAVFKRKYNLGCSFMFCDLPTIGQLENLSRSFDRCCYEFINPAELTGPLHRRGWCLEDANKQLLEILRYVEEQRHCVANVSFVSRKPSGLKNALLKSRWESVRIKENHEWLLPRPEVKLLKNKTTKARQAGRLTRISRGMSYYESGRALAPSLYPILDSFILLGSSRNLSTILRHLPVAYYCRTSGAAAWWIMDSYRAA